MSPNLSLRRFRAASFRTRMPGQGVISNRGTTTAVCVYTTHIDGFRTRLSFRRCITIMRQLKRTFQKTAMRTHESRKRARCSSAPSLCMKNKGASPTVSPFSRGRLSIESGQYLLMISTSE